MSKLYQQFSGSVTVTAVLQRAMLRSVSSDVHLNYKFIDILRKLPPITAATKHIISICMCDFFVNKNKKPILLSFIFTENA